MVATVHLRPGHVQPVWLGHPWVYAQAVGRVEGEPAPGDDVVVRDPRGNPLGRGYWSPSSAIPVRVLTRDVSAELDARWLHKRIAEAAAWRRSLLGLPSADTNGYRLINAEGDGLAGLIADVFGDSVVVQLLTVGMKRREAAIAAALREVTGAARVFEVSSPKHQALEGIESREGILAGEDAEALTFTEGGNTWTLPAPGKVGAGQKTGYFFDQRDNRARVGALASGKRVLDLFCYLGGFAMAAARGGATEVLGVDSAAGAIAAATAAAAANGVDGVVRFERGDALKVAVALDQKNERFDLVICDPPKLAGNAREVEGALRHYRKVNSEAARRVTTGGLLLTCSCSGHVTPEEFIRAVLAGVRDAGRDAVMLRLDGAASDHPTPLAFVEGRYLKCATLRIT
ncbi:MAG: m5C1962 methyltransferase RlmI [Myxococcaceae bacterium]|nr:m5C1962 methyltransferase RlmI [Myxococcaceae bacterium]